MGLIFISRKDKKSMEKIKLTNALEYPAYGFEQHEKILKFTVAGVADYATFRATLNAENLATIEVYSEGGTLSTIFEGYTTLTGKFDIEENEDNTMDIAVYIEKPDPLLQRMAELEAEIEALKSK